MSELTFMDLMRQPAQKPIVLEPTTVEPAVNSWQAAVDIVEPLPRSAQFLAERAARAERIAEHDRHNNAREQAQFERMRAKES